MKFIFSLMLIYTYSDLITKKISETNPNMQYNTLQRTLKGGGCHPCRVDLRFPYITMAQNGLVTYSCQMVFIACGLNLGNLNFFQYEEPIKNYTNSAIRKIRNKNRKLRLNKFFGFFQTCGGAMIPRGGRQLPRRMRQSIILQFFWPKTA